MKAEVAEVNRCMFNVPSQNIAEEFFQAAIQKYGVSAPRLSASLEDNLAEGFTVYSFPFENCRSIRTTNNLERVNRAIRRQKKW